MTVSTAAATPALREPPHVEFDARRPWPLGLPSKEHALAAIISYGEVAEALEGTHLHALTLFPEWVFDEARTALANAGTELAWAAASAWRAVVAREFIERALSVDAAALTALTKETVEARERLEGYANFALDGGAGSTELLATLDECIARFSALAAERAEKAEKAAQVEAEKKERAKEAAPPAPRVVAPSRPRQPVPASAKAAKDSRRLLGVAAGLVAVFVLLYALSGTTGPASAHEEWSVRGSLDSGEARLVPASAQASEAALQQKLAQLKQTGVQAKWVNGEWVLTREQPPAP
jgi:hypothetical protein